MVMNSTPCTPLLIMWVHRVSAAAPDAHYLITASGDWDFSNSIICRLLCLKHVAPA